MKITEKRPNGPNSPAEAFLLTPEFEEEKRRLQYYLEHLARGATKILGTSPTAQRLGLILDEDLGGACGFLSGAGIPARTLSYWEARDLAYAEGRDPSTVSREDLPQVPLWENPSPEKITFAEDGTRILPMKSIRIDGAYRNFSPAPLNPDWPARAHQEIDLLPLPDFSCGLTPDSPGLSFQPMPHQIWWLRRNITFQHEANFVDVGLGKSFVSLATFFARHKISQGRENFFLVVAPKAVLPTWFEEIPKFLPENWQVFGILDQQLTHKGKVVGHKVAGPGRGNYIEMASMMASPERPIIVLTNYETFRINPEVKEEGKSAKRKVGGWTVEHLEKRAEEGVKIVFHCAVLDESANIKNTDAQAFRGLMKIQHHFLRRIVLSGIPAPQNPGDYAGQVAFLHPSYLNFKSRRAMEHECGYGKNYQKVQWKADKVRWIHRRIHQIGTVMTKEDAHVSVPEKTYHTVPVEMTPEQARLYDSLRQEFETWFEGATGAEKAGISQVSEGSEEILRIALENDPMAALYTLQKELEELQESGVVVEDEKAPEIVNSGVIYTPNILAKICRLTQLTGGWLCGLRDPAAVLANGGSIIGVPTLPPEPIRDETGKIVNPKMDALLNLVGSLREEGVGNPLVICTRFTHEVREIHKRLTEKGLRGSWIDGGVSTQKRMDIIADFNDGSSDFIILQADSGKYGLNLQKSCVLIYYSNSYSYNARGQSEGRIHRLGQTRPCRIYDLLCTKSIDALVLHTLKMRKDLSELLLRRPELIKNPELYVGIEA